MALEVVGGKVHKLEDALRRCLAAGGEQASRIRDLEAEVERLRDLVCEADIWTLDRERERIEQLRQGADSGESEEG